MLIAHKIALDPNNVQATYFARAAGTARFADNWALAEWTRQYEAHKADPSQPKPSQAALRPIGMGKREYNILSINHLIIRQHEITHPFLSQFVTTLGKTFGEGSHRDTVLSQHSGLVARYFTTDVSYISDRLNAVLRMPAE